MNPGQRKPFQEVRALHKSSPCPSQPSSRGPSLDLVLLLPRWSLGEPKSNAPREGQLTKPWGRRAAGIAGTLRSSGSRTLRKEEESSGLSSPLFRAYTDEVSEIQKDEQLVSIS